MDQVGRIPRRLHLTRRIYIAILLVAVITGAVLVYVYYSMGVASVTSLTIDQVLADRNFTGGTYPNRNVSYVFEVKIWSKAQALSVNLQAPTFSANAEGVSLGNETLGGGTILPGSSLTYSLRFNTNESRNIAVLSFSGSNVCLYMTSSAGSGIYSQTLRVHDSATWNWTTAALIVNYGTNYC
jgi:hypothetical protein